MGRLLDNHQDHKYNKEKALGNYYTRREQDDHKYMDSLEKNSSAFYFQDFEETNRSHDGGDDFESDSSELAERMLYWEAQEALLQEILERHSLTGYKLRAEVTRMVEKVRETEFCCCPKPSSDDCTHCLRRLVVNSLCDKGLNAYLCTSKWKHTRKFPGGTHEYIEVMTTNSGRKKQIPFLIELEFRDQFAIAKACDGYRKLVSHLPEFYIGKAEYLYTIVRILCNAAKTSMKEKKIHMGPWRKRSFMEMKWSYSLKSRSLDEPSNKFSLLPPTQSSTHESVFHVSAAPAVAVT